MKEAKTGMATIAKEFAQMTLDGQQYTFSEAAMNNIKKPLSTFLLPDYDEYGMSYKNRGMLFDNRIDITKYKAGNPVFNHIIVIDGIFGGTWQRTIKNKTAVIETALFTALNKRKQQALTKAIKRYQSFTEDV